MVEMTSDVVVAVIGLCQVALTGLFAYYLQDKRKNDAQKAAAEDQGDLILKVAKAQYGVIESLVKRDRTKGRRHGPRRP